MCYVLTKYVLNFYVLCYAFIFLVLGTKKNRKINHSCSHAQKNTQNFSYLLLDKLNETGLSVFTYIYIYICVCVCVCVCVFTSVVLHTRVMCDSL